MNPDLSSSRAVDGRPRAAAAVDGGGVPAVTTEALVRVLRQAGEKPALLLEVSRHTGDARRLQLHVAPHHREDVTSLLGRQSAGEPAVAADHARLSARDNVGRRGSTFTIEFPMPVGQRAGIAT